MAKGAMESLWATVSQADKKGNRLIRYKGQYDLLYLYANGFVDFKKYTLDDWVKAFDDSRQPDASYRVTKEQWLAKEKYRYTGPVGEPFDPRQLQEREFTEKEFEAVIRHFICPSTWIPESNIPQILDHYRKEKKLVKGKIRIDKEIKKEIQDVLDKMPSPLRVLQFDVAMHRKKGGLPAPRSVTPGTGYVAGDDAQKIAAAGLNELIHSGQAQQTAVPEKSSEGIPLKDLLKKKGKKGPGRA